LKRLESLRFEFGPLAAEEKVRCLNALTVARLKNADQVARLHDVLCFMQAWPDTRAVLSLVERMLDGFERRPDLTRDADELANTGIAGTSTHFSFYAATARWLVDRWPDRLHIDWEAFEHAALLERYLSLLASYSETSGLDSVAMELPEWIGRLKGIRETDALFVLRRLAVLIPDEFLHDQLYEDLELPLILAPGPGVPTRTRAKYQKSPIFFQAVPLDRTRPVIDAVLRRPLKPPKPASRAEGKRLVGLARSAMITRERDLDAFAYADPNDVSLVNDDDLQFVLHGMMPRRRFLLETQYGFVVLKNGVPISYGTIISLFASAEIAYTIFDTFRGGESARLYMRTLAMVHQVFGCDTFMVDPYQLGEDNVDALKSGAWWFYQKLGFRPRDKKLLRVMRRELSAMKRQPRHRSSMAVLRQLATENVYLDLNQQRDDVVGELDLANVGLRITDLLAERFGSNRELGEETLASEAAVRLGSPSFRGWSPTEKLAWRRWSPLVALLKGAERWPAADRDALVQVIRAKGGRRELDYLQQFDGHRRLRNALVRLARG
jgi:hypothetical protein